MSRLFVSFKRPKEIETLLPIIHRIFLFTALLLALPVVGAYSQAPIIEEPGYKPSLTFDVATIRPALPVNGNFRVSIVSPPHSSRFEATNLTIKALLQIAYGFDTPIANAPDWITSTFYDIKARSDEATDAKLAMLTDNQSRLEKRNAIRSLLADRLGFKFHEEIRNSSIYNLIVNKGGLKMHVIAPPQNGESSTSMPLADLRAHPSRHGLEFVGSNASMRAICGALSSMVELPVVDRTGLTGSYTYTLQFGREWSADDPESWPSIFTAVQDQLGLKLEAAREAIPNLVINQLLKPTEN
jgi:uncharacterized protein (TIGR03435 family)